MTCVPVSFARSGLTAVAAMAAALAFCPAAQASMAAIDPFADLQPLDHAELGNSRGGMMINGIPVNFAVMVRTTVEGAVSQGLQTMLTVNDQGGLGSAVTTAIGANAAGGATVTANGDGGMTMSLPTGTRIIHQTLADQITTLIANTKNDVALNQRTEVNVDLPGFHALTQTWYGNNRAAQMGIDAALSGLGRR
ncbi:MAG: hypothetical protein K2X44_10985 [Magnetospirillum sp.]|nr:hypothetical protein [Magnetospirillum sp.]